MTSGHLSSAPASDRTGVGQTPDTPFVVAVVLNWNNLPDTLECIQSLRASDYPNLSVVVVDNGSQQDPTMALKEAYPEVHVLRNSQNLGYGGGNNEGVRVAIAQGAVYVLILNNDAVVAPSMVRRLVTEANRDSRIGMATPTVFYYDRPTDVCWDGGTIDWLTGNAPHDSQGLPSTDGVISSEWLEGSALLARVAAIQDVGLLDDRYFLYYEDADWTIRAGRRGWRNVVVKEAQAWHKVSGSTRGRANPAVGFYFLRNRYLFMTAYHPAARAIGWRARYLLKRVGREYLWARYERPARHAILAALLDILAGRSGPYQVPAGRRRLIAVLDTFLAPLRMLVNPVKRAIGWVNPTRFPRTWV